MTMPKGPTFEVPASISRDELREAANIAEKMKRGHVGTLSGRRKLANAYLFIVTRNRTELEAMLASGE